MICECVCVCVCVCVGGGGNCYVLGIQLRVRTHYVFFPLYELKGSPKSTKLKKKGGGEARVSSPPPTPNMHPQRSIIRYRVGLVGLM